MKKNLCKIMACIVVSMAIGGYNITDVKAETNFVPALEQKDVCTPFSAQHYTNKKLEHHFYVYRGSSKTALIDNYQTTYWVYDAISVGLYQSPTNIIWNIDSDVQFLNGDVMEDHIVGQYTYGGDVYYKGVNQGSVSFSTTMKTTGEYKYSRDPVLYF